MIVTAKILSVN